jgi:Uma2 family endonuclease
MHTRLHWESPFSREACLMGQFTSHEALVLRWAELCIDPQLRDLPGKIELNAYGVIELTPASNRHARRQAAVVFALSQQLPAGNALVECSIATAEGVRVPDVAWASSTFLARHGVTTPFPAAPEICVEVRSPSNTDEEMALKTRLYLEAGAVEVWIVSELGVWEIYNAQGAQPTSRYAVQLNLPIPR